MKTLYTCISFLLLNFMAHKSNCQFYKIEYFEEKYDTLRTYTSICNENALNFIEPFFFTKMFEFGFDFPFFGKNYSAVTLDNDGVGSFEGTVQYNFYLFSGIWHVYYWNDSDSYEIGNPVESDWRYTHTTINGKKVLIVEQRHVAPFVFDTKHAPYEGGDVNFQQWFWENGDIEVRFGDIKIDTSVFKGALVDPRDSSLYALSIGIQNYENTEQLFIEGTIDNFILAKFDEENSLDSLPKPNTGVRFRYLPVSTDEAVNSASKGCNLVGSDLQLDNSDGPSTYFIYNISGQLVKEGYGADEIDTSQLAAGSYVLQQRSETKTTSRLFVKM